MLSVRSLHHKGDENGYQTRQERQRKRAGRKGNPENRTVNWRLKVTPSCVQLYVGDGYGKSMAVFGLAVRMSFYSRKVYIGRFWNREVLNERKVSDFIPFITVCTYISENGGPGGETEKRTSAREGFSTFKSELASGKYALVIGDAMLDALERGWLSKEEVLQLLGAKPPASELVLTGRFAPDWLIERADLVTERTNLDH